MRSFSPIGVVAMMAALASAGSEPCWGKRKQQDMLTMAMNDGVKERERKGAGKMLDMVFPVVLAGISSSVALSFLALSSYQDLWHGKEHNLKTILTGKGDGLENFLGIVSLGLLAFFPIVTHLYEKKIRKLVDDIPFNISEKMSIGGGMIQEVSERLFLPKKNMEGKSFFEKTASFLEKLPFFKWTIPAILLGKVAKDIVHAYAPGATMLPMAADLLKSSGMGLGIYHQYRSCFQKGDEIGDKAWQNHEKNDWEMGSSLTSSQKSREEEKMYRMLSNGVTMEDYVKSVSEMASGMFYGFPKIVGQASMMFYEVPQVAAVQTFDMMSHMISKVIPSKAEIEGKSFFDTMGVVFQKLPYVKWALPAALCATVGQKVVPHAFSSPFYLLGAALVGFGVYKQVPILWEGYRDFQEKTLQKSMRENKVKSVQDRMVADGASSKKSRHHQKKDMV